MKKRIIALLLALVLMFSLVACSTSDDASDSSAADKSDASDATGTDDAATGADDTADADDADDSSDSYVAVPDLVDLTADEVRDVLYNFTQTAPKEPIKIGMVMSNAPAPILAASLEGMRAYAEHLGNIEFLEADAQNDVNAMVDAFENFINADCDIIFTHNIFPDALAEPIERAVSQGIIVGSLDEIDSNAQVNFLSEGTTQGGLVGEAAAAWINEEMDGKAKIGIITQDESATHKKRADAIIDVVTKLCPESEIVVRQTVNSVAEAYEMGEMLMESYPEINCYIGTSDDRVAGIDMAYVDAGWEGELGIIGCDCNSDAMEQFGKEGSFYVADIYFNLPMIFNAMMQICIDKYNSGDTSRVVYNHSLAGITVTKDTYADYLDLPAY